MNRPNVSTVAGIALLAAGVIGAVGVVGASATDGSTAGVSAGTSARIAVIGTSVAATPAAVPPTTVVGRPLPATVATPIVPSLGNAGLALTVEAGETVRVLTVDEWRAIQVAYPESPMTLARIGVCETGLNVATHIIDTNGEWTDGAFGVQPKWHGTVPPSLELQAKQAAGILREYGTKPFTTAGGCDRWNKTEAPAR
jgi:hypothetical protein